MVAFYQIFFQKLYLVLFHAEHLVVDSSQIHV